MAVKGIMKMLSELKEAWLVEKRPLGSEGKRGLAQLGGVEASRFALS